MSSIGRSGWARVGALLLALAFAGCGAGTDPAPAYPNIVGTFTGTWEQVFSGNGQVLIARTCACTFIVPSQLESIFYARSTLASPCDTGLISGQGLGGTLSVSDGRVEPNGAVTFRFSGEPPVGLGFGGGCTVTAMDPFAGTLSGNTLSASRVESYDCRPADGFQYSITTRLVAIR